MDALDRALANTKRMHQNAVASIGTNKNADLARIVQSPGFPSISGGSKLSKAAEQYQHFRGWAYVAVNAIATRCAAQELYVARRGTTRTRKAYGEQFEPLADHSVLKAIDNPNPLMCRWSLLFSTVASLKLTGRSAWWITQEPQGLTIWPLPTHWIEPVDRFRSSWKVRPPGANEDLIVPGEQIAYFSLPDPSNPFASTSPLQSQAAAIATDEAIQTAQYRGFANGVNPGMAVTVGRMPGMMPGEKGERPILTEEQRQEIRDAVARLYQGVIRHNEPLIIDGMIESFERITNTIQEMDFLDSGKATKARVMQALGVNPIIVGEIDGANRAQAAVAESSFLANTIQPLLTLIGQTLTKWENARPNSERLVFWFETPRANDPEQRLAEWEAGLRHGAVTLQEYRTRVLNLPGGDARFDVALQPSTMLPAE